MEGNSADDPFNFDTVSDSPAPETGPRHAIRRRKHSGLPAKLADGLQAGADALRQRRSAPSSGSGVTALVNDPALAEISDSLATGMESGADWLRDADLDKLKTGVEKQVKEHPGRTLLVALGAGFLLGKILRR